MNGSVIRDLIRKFRSSSAPDTAQKEISLRHDAEVGVQVRQYNTYTEYLEHQASKLPKAYESIQKSDLAYEEIVRSRYAEELDFRGKSVLCLAARLGGEVRAFKSLGSLAIGIDVEPGMHNPHVLFGDVHNIQFPADTFDVAFTNAIDHFLNVSEFIDEVYRVLKPFGVFFLEMTGSKQARPSANKYEVVDMTDHAPLITALSRRFEIETVGEVVNKTEFINWNGTFVKCRKLTR